MASLVFDSLLTDLLALLAVGVVTFYWYFTRTYDYWEKRGVPYVSPTTFFGNIRDMALLKKSQGLVFQDLYNELEGHKYGGIFQLRTPTLLLRDPEIIKTVMVKDFPHFQDRGLPVDPKKNPLSQHLFSIGGWKWRVLRTKLSPTFTSGKIKMMFHAVEECSLNLQKYLEKPAEKGEILELKEILAKFSTDVIGTCAFGLQMNALDNPDSEFRTMGKRIFAPTPTRALRRIVAIFLPVLAKLTGLSLLEKDIVDFFMNVVRETVQYREKNNIKRNDFLQLMIDLKNQGKVENEENEENETTNGVIPEISHGIIDKHSPKDLELDDGLFAAQAFVFFLAGFETSSTTMSFALHELAVNPDVQSRLREEIDRTLEGTGGKITYDAVMNMKYLDKVVSETLRKYPAVPNLIREVTIPYKLKEGNLELEKGLKVSIPVYALHHDPKYFPDPEKFDPERFNEENKAKRPHYVYLPFGEGPRNCIGMRFGLLQTKMGLTSLLAKYEFHVCERTELPIGFDPRAAVTASYTGTILRITNRS